MSILFVILTRLFLGGESDFIALGIIRIDVAGLSAAAKGFLVSSYTQFLLSSGSVTEFLVSLRFFEAITAGAHSIIIAPYVF